MPFRSIREHKQHHPEKSRSKAIPKQQMMASTWMRMKEKERKSGSALCPQAIINHFSCKMNILNRKSNDLPEITEAGKLWNHSILIGKELD